MDVYIINLSFSPRNIIMLDSHSIEELQPIPEGSAQAYASNRDALVQKVNQLMSAHDNISELIGSPNNLEMMCNNHQNHADFMIAILLFNRFEVLKNTLPWIYSNYVQKGFKYAYFEAELLCWKTAIENILPKDEQKAVINLYDWILKRHQLTVLEAKQFFKNIPPQTTDALAFEQKLLIGDTFGAIEFMQKRVTNPADLSWFYQDVIQPSLYSIGQKWESGQISVAEEHLATAISTRVMTMAYQRYKQAQTVYGKALVASAPLEEHDLGAWMVADLLEQDGWDVRFLGANTPAFEMIRDLKTYQRDIFALSLTMFSRLKEVQQLIRQIRDTPELQNLKILVGGQGVVNSLELALDLGADGYAVNGTEAVILARKWYSELHDDSYRIQL